MISVVPPESLRIPPEIGHNCSWPALEEIISCVLLCVVQLCTCCARKMPSSYVGLMEVWGRTGELSGKFLVVLLKIFSDSSNAFV